MWGDLGYELDLTKMSEEDSQKVKEQVKDYKAIRQVTQYGDLYRLENPKYGNQAAWMVVSPNQDEAVVTWVQILSYAQNYLTKTKLAGLDPKKHYKDLATGEIYGGDELMEMGIYDPVIHKDFASKMYHFKAVD